MRKGSFSQGAISYGAPLGYIHPPDNTLPPQFDPLLDDAALGLSDAQKADLQDRIDDLFDTLRGERDYL